MTGDAAGNGATPAPAAGATPGTAVSPPVPSPPERSPTIAYPRLIAHRGGGAGFVGLAPENTLAGLAAAHAAGYRGVEFDVMLSADGIPFLHHDDTLERTTSGKGPIAAASAAVLDRLDAGRWRDPAYTGEALPRLAAALELCLDAGLWINLEIKPTTGRDRATAQAVAATLLARWPTLAGPPSAPNNGGTLGNRSPAADPVSTFAPPPLVVSSFSPAALAEIARLVPALPRALLVGALPRDGLAQCRALGCCGLHLDATYLDRRTLAALRTAAPDLRLAAYTVNDPARMAELFAAGIDALFTDRIDLDPLGLVPATPVGALPAGPGNVV